MERTELFQKALSACSKLLSEHPDSRGIQSIICQLDYLISIESRKSTDRSRLHELTIGILAVREVEPWDKQLAAILYDVDAEARRM
jgi:hypothetical protein